LDGSDVPQNPDEVDGYLLGAFGGVRTMGKDVLGEEDPVPLPDKQQGFNWTRSQLGNEPRERFGSPFYIGPDYKPVEGWTVRYGNPNGLCDAVVLVLTSEPATVRDGLNTKPADAK
jgi:hypothetical protein